jgi:hypothetical protein
MAKERANEMPDPSEDPKGDTFNAIQEIADHSPSTPIAPATGIAAMALNMALKYHDINTVQDGALYQQYKLEGRNMRSLHLDHVFETAIRMEMHLLGASERIAKIVVEAVLDLPPETDDNAGSPSAEGGAQTT